VAVGATESSGARHEGQTGPVQASGSGFMQAAHSGTRLSYARHSRLTTVVSKIRPTSNNEAFPMKCWISFATEALR
jgi:hypothetical protein